MRRPARVAALALLGGIALLAGAPARAESPPERRFGIGSNLSASGWTAGDAVPRDVPPTPPLMRPAPAAPAPPPGNADADLGLARVAWSYFAPNRDPRNGLVAGADGYGLVTMWDVGSSLAGLLSAHQLALIDDAELDRLLTQLLATLAALPLYADELPNRAYAVAGPAMVDLDEHPSTRGSGWSALDIGRLLVWLRIAAQWHPAHAAEVDAVVRRWRFERLASAQELNGVLDDGGRALLRQEGRFGYEQYAAAAYRLWGVDVARAFDLEHVRRVELFGRSLLTDTRNLAFLTSDPFILARLEIGAVEPSFDGAVDAMYAVQRARGEQTGTPTAVAEDAVDQPPWFVYDNVYFAGAAWVCVDHNGRPTPARHALSAKAALGWWAIFPDPYSTGLRALVGERLSGPRGVLGGIYAADGHPNRSLNVNTNAVALESLLYRRRGGRPFLSAAGSAATRP